MTTAPQIAALLAGYALALVRLLTDGKPFWSHAKLPAWIETLIPALIVSLPAFAQALGLVHTNLDLASCFITAAGAIFVAMRGTPQSDSPKQAPNVPTLPAIFAFGASFAVWTLIAIVAVNCGLFGGGGGSTRPVSGCNLPSLTDLVDDLSAALLAQDYSVARVEALATKYGNPALQCALDELEKQWAPADGGTQAAPAKARGIERLRAYRADHKAGA